MKQTKVFDAIDRTREMGWQTYEELITGFSELKRRKLMQAGLMGMAQKVKQWNGQVRDDALKAVAYINGGRWLAPCPTCHGIEFVTPVKPIFYCHTCDNEEIQQAARPCEFPTDAERSVIEADLLKNELTLPARLAKLYSAITTTELAAAAQPLEGFRRLDWGGK